MFVMVNHGMAEAAMAQKLCGAAGLAQSLSFAEPGVLSAHRTSPALVSCWVRSEQYSY